MFLTLVDRGVEPLFLRLMMYVYRNQRCNVKWSDQYSSEFTVSNGVRQGAVSSAILFAVYIDEILRNLRKAKIGCHINGIFYGALVFADDILLLSASCSGLQAMVDMCHSFAAKKNLKFGTDPNPDKSKTKCIVFSKRKRDQNQLRPINLDGVPLPWVSKVKYLGNLLLCDNSMSQDGQLKRAKYIGKVNSLLQEFHYIDAEIMTKLMNLYATSFYGSGTWDIYSADCEKHYKSWNVTMRTVYNLDRCTHRYLLEQISGCLHPKVMLASRYVTFVKSLVNSNKFSVRYLARWNERDHRTVLGRTLCRMKAECDVSKAVGLLTPGAVKRNMKYSHIKEGEQWRINLILELIEVRARKLGIPDFETNEVDEMIKHLCIS